MEEEILIPIVMFASIAFVLYYYFKYRYLERQAIIEKGISAENVKDVLKKSPKQKTTNEANLAKWGIILIAIGLAILIGTQFSDEVMLGLIFIFPGVGLLIYYSFIVKKTTKTEE
jgi:uncharacterized membrane protein